MTPQSNFMVLAPIQPAREIELRRLRASMNDAPGSARLMVGSGQWRWADLLFTRGVVRR